MVPDLSVRLGPLELKNPIVAASGTFGLGLEMSSYVDLSELGAVTVKSLSSEPWSGNPPPRLVPTPGGMLNSVGLQNPGVDAWRRETLPLLKRAGATVIASIWGKSIDEFSAAASSLAGADGIGAIEVNLSCPNLDSSQELFAHSTVASAEVIRTVVRAVRPLPVFAKLSPNTDLLVEVASEVTRAGATGLTLINTLIGLRLDLSTGRPALGGGTGGLSGPAVLPIALRAVYATRQALPDIPIIGTGGVSCGVDAAEMLMAGASAVGVGTASFHDPRATLRILEGLRRWCSGESLASVSDIRARGAR